MREISLDRLRTLVAIADQGSFVAAAQLLHLAPPTVSLHVAELESRVGAPLLSRTRGNVRPSAIGEVLVERARSLLAEVESTLDDVQRQVQGLTGRVRLGASTGAIAHLLPQAVARLREQHPDLAAFRAQRELPDAVVAVADERRGRFARIVDEQLQVLPVGGIRVEDRLEGGVRRQVEIAVAVRRRLETGLTGLFRIRPAAGDLDRRFPAEIA